MAKIFQQQNSWVNYFDTMDTSSIGSLSTPEEFRHHANAVMWGLGLIIFGFCVLAYDTQTNRANHQHLRSEDGEVERRFRVRDHILGLEQRHFLVVLNGILLYVFLAFLTDPNKLTSTSV